LRFLLVRPYLVVYRVTDAAVEILRVLHTARDVRSVLDLDSFGNS
jgi:plasmid stabilization system protein ParE